MRIFFGFAAVGLMWAWRTIPSNKPASRMSNFEFAADVIAHLLVAAVVGLAGWGIITGMAAL